MTSLKECWQRHFLVFEAFLALLVSIAFTFWFYGFEGATYVNSILAENRATFYGTMASIYASLLGFLITATSIVLGFSVSDKLMVLRGSEEYPKLWKIFSSTIWILGVTTLVSLLCLLLDKDNNPVPFLIPVILTLTLLSLIRIARTIWALEHIIKLVTKK
jgi:hypothetical protein